MAEEIVAKYRVDVTEASKNLTDLANAAKRAEDALKKYEQASSSAFDKGKAGAKALTIEVEKQPKAVEATQAELKELKDLLREIAKVGTEGFKQVTKAIKETEAAIDKANGKLEDTKKQGTGLIGTFKNLAVTLGVAFGVQQIISFAKEAVNLAAKAEGVERAFQRIGSTSILEELRAATRGTVTDLVLMQNAVKASNFKIPLEQLGSLFAFAQARARETGESVDYLVDSIILGIGRKSPLILDNLGISAVELRTRLKGVGVEAANIGDIAQIIGDIATEEMQKMGNQADTTADRLAQLSTVFDNLLTKGGESLVKLGTGFAYLLDLLPDVDAKAIALTKSLESFKDMRIQDLASGYRSIDEIVGEMLKKQFDSNKLQERRIELEERLVEISTGSRASAVIQEQKDIRERLVAIDEMIKRYGGEAKALSEIIELEQKRAEAANANDSSIKNVYYYTEAIKALNEKINAQETAEADIMPLIKERAILQAELTKLTTEQATGTALLNQQLSELKKELDSAEIGGAGFWAVLDKIEKKTKELWEASAMTKLADALIPDVESEDASLLARIGRENDIEQQAYLDKMKMREDFDAFLKEQDDERVRQALEAVDKERQARETTQRLTVDLVQSTLSAFGDIYSSLNQIAQNSANAELAILQKKYDEGQISAEQFEQEQIRIQRESAQRAKEAATFNAIIGASQAAINALSSPGVPFPVALAFSLLAVATAAAQIAAIQSTPLPQFAEGGWVDAKGKIHGRKHAQGGVQIEAEGDEFIVKGSMAKRYPNIIEAVNQGTIMRLIQESYVAPAVNAAMFSGFQDIGRSAELNGLTANLKDHNIIAALDRSRQANTYGFAMLAEQLSKNTKVNRRKQW